MRRFTGVELPHQRGAVLDGVEPDKVGAGCPDMMNVVHTEDGSGLMSMPGHHRTSTRQLMATADVNPYSLFHRIVMFPGEWIRDASSVGIAIIDETTGAPLKLASFKPLVPPAVFVDPDLEVTDANFLNTLYATGFPQTIGHIRRHSGQDEIYITEFENKVYIGSQFDEALVYDGHELRTRGIRPPILAPSYNRFHIWAPPATVEPSIKDLMLGTEASGWVIGSGRTEVTIEHAQGVSPQYVNISVPSSEGTALGTLAYFVLPAAKDIQSIDGVFSLDWFKFAIESSTESTVNVTLALDTTTDFTSLAADRVVLQGLSTNWGKFTDSSSVNEEFEVLSGSEHLDGSFNVQSIGLILNDVIPQHSYTTRTPIRETYMYQPPDIPGYWVRYPGSINPTWVPPVTPPQVQKTRIIGYKTEFVEDLYNATFQIAHLLAADVETTVAPDRDGYKSNFAFALVNEIGIESNLSPATPLVVFDPGDKFYLNLTGDQSDDVFGYENVFGQANISSIRAYVHREDWGNVTDPQTGEKRPLWRRISDQQVPIPDSNGNRVLEYAQLTTWDELLASSYIPNDNHFLPPATSLCVADGQRLIQAGEAKYSVGHVDIADQSHELTMRVAYSADSDSQPVFFTRYDLGADYVASGGSPYENGDYDLTATILNTVNPTQYFQAGYRVGDTYGAPSGTASVAFSFAENSTPVWGPHLEDNSVQLHEEKDRYFIRKALPMDVNDLTIYQPWHLDLWQDHWVNGGDDPTPVFHTPESPKGYVAWPFVQRWGLTPWATDGTGAEFDAPLHSANDVTSDWPYDPSGSYASFASTWLRTTTQIAKSDNLLMWYGDAADVGVKTELDYVLPVVAGGHYKVKLWIFGVAWSNPLSTPLGGLSEADVQETMHFQASMGGSASTELTGIHSSVSSLAYSSFPAGAGFGAQYGVYDGYISNDAQTLETSFPARVEEFDIIVQDPNDPLKLSFQHPVIGDCLYVVYVQVFGANVAESGFENFQVGQLTPTDTLAKAAYDRLYVLKGDEEPHDEAAEDAEYVMSHGRDRLWWSIKDTAYGTYPEAVGVSSFIDLEMPGDDITALERLNGALLVYGSKYNTRVSQNHGVLDGGAGSVFQRPIRFDGIPGCLSSKSIVTVEGGLTYHLSPQGEIVQTSLGDTAIHPSSRLVKEWFRDKTSFPDNSIREALGFYVASTNAIVWMFPEYKEDVTPRDERGNLFKRDYHNDGASSLYTGDSPTTWAPVSEANFYKWRNLRATPFLVKGIMFKLDTGNIYPIWGDDISCITQIAATNSIRGAMAATLFGANNAGYVNQLFTPSSTSWGCPIEQSVFEVGAVGHDDALNADYIELSTPVTLPIDILKHLKLALRKPAISGAENENFTALTSQQAQVQDLGSQGEVDRIYYEAYGAYTLSPEVGDMLHIAPMLSGVMFPEQRTRYPMVIEGFSANIHDETSDIAPVYSGSGTNMPESQGQPLTLSIMSADDNRNVLTLDETMKSTEQVRFKSNDMDDDRGVIYLPPVAAKALALSLHWTRGFPGRFVISDPRVDMKVHAKEPKR